MTSLQQARREETPPSSSTYPTISASTSTSTPKTYNISSPPSPPSTTQQSSSFSPPSSIGHNPDPEAARRTLEARTAFTASLYSVGQTVSSDLRARAADLHSNAAAIQKQENDLTKHTAELSKQNDQWDKVVDSARQGLKEIGDVQNWAEMIERDLLVVEEVLRLVEGGGDEDDEENMEVTEGEMMGQQRWSHGEHDLEGQEEAEDANLIERDENTQKANPEPVHILDDVSSATSGISGTSATVAGTILEASGKSSPSDGESEQRPINANEESNKRTYSGWWKWWW